MNDRVIALVVRALGLDPDTIQAQLAGLQNWIVNSIRNLDARIRAMETDRALMHEKLDYLADQNRRILGLLQNGVDDHGEEAFGLFRGTAGRNPAGLHGPVNGAGGNGTAGGGGTVAGSDTGEPAGD